jgi:hypothetical protein
MIDSPLVIVNSNIDDPRDARPDLAAARAGFAARDLRA